ncbi:dipeptidyl peptidase IV N-terminal region-domain-containing protein [Gongronella butleri]|nr:dipeptidyl peptidase IV N-terminal region-domain-containing protein [Gongronella butleri]
METDFTWDKIRAQVKKVRTLSQHHLVHYNMATCKAIQFFPKKHTLFFLANNPDNDSQYPRFLDLFSVDYADMVRSASPAKLSWEQVAPKYTLPDSAMTWTFNGISSFQIVDEMLLIVHLGHFYAGRLGDVPRLVQSIPKRNPRVHLPVARANSIPGRPPHPSGPTNSFAHSISSSSLVHDVSTPTDPKLGGIHGDLIAFVRDRDLWVVDFEGNEAQLTFCSDQANDALSCGTAEYIMQEEFHRDTGYFWCPSSLGRSVRKNRILFVETDERNVDWVDYSKGQAIHGNDTPPECTRYPRAGQPNATSHLRIVEFDAPRHSLPPPQATPRPAMHHKRLWGKNDLQYRFPWAEYIVRLDWMPDGQSIWAQLLSRDQQRTSVIRIPYALFQTHEQYVDHASLGDIEELWTETSSAWINVSDAFFFCDASTMIWSSERSGFRHLYYVEKKSDEPASVRALTSGQWCVLDKPIFVDEVRRLVYFMGKKDTPLEAHLYVTSFATPGPVRRLTQLGFHHSIDMSPECEFFVDAASNLHQPHGHVLRRLVFDASDALPRVDHAESSNTTAVLIPEACDTKHFTFSSECDDDDLVMVPPTLPWDHDHRPWRAPPSHPRRPSSPSPPSSILDEFGHNHTQKASISSLAHHLLASNPPAPVTATMPNQPTRFLHAQVIDAVLKAEKCIHTIPKAELFQFTTPDGALLHGCLYKPRFYQPGISYPTLVYIYGGPKSQMVTNEFRYPRVLRYLLAVHFGFAVVVIDGRGSCDRGLAFEAHVQYRLGRVELQDQIHGLQFLHSTCFGALPTADGSRVSVIDLDRVAITGWSFGGYLSLLALAHHGDLFKMAIAGAPVTDWALYDSAYTERYMGLPQDHPQEYNLSSVLNWAKDFPQEEHRLIIVHGLIDENVHFRNTEKLVAELDKYNKPYHLQVYPTEKHGLRHASVNEHFDTLMFHHLVNYL